MTKISSNEIKAKAILQVPISKLDVSAEFIAITKKYGYHTLADLLQLKKPYDVLQHEGFNYRLLAEYTHLLAENGLAEHLK